MRLNNQNLDQIAQANHIPYANRNSLREKIVQFGTGVLLRGLPDYYIDRANREDNFNGSIVMIKSTQQGDLSPFEEQDYLYSLQTQGLIQGVPVETKEIITCISRVLTASEDWDKVLAYATDQAIEFIFSNTTEAGIVASEHELINNIPKSFPGKLTAFLYHRFKTFNGSNDSGLIILPTELIDNNAQQLLKIVCDLAEKNKLPAAFISWIKHDNHFCNTLVDRIVPGKINSTKWTYQDEFAIRAEPFNLWAIEVQSDKIKQKLSFAKANPEIKLLSSIKHIKELKLRLLNATHTLTCPIAIFSKHQFVRETLAVQKYEHWIKKLMSTIISPHLHYQGITESEISEFANSLIDRFKNPTIDHQWSAIAQNSTNKWRQRVLPILESWYLHQEIVPKPLALSLAAYIACHQFLMTTDFPYDDQIKKALDQHIPIEKLMADVNIWSVDLNLYPGFVKEVKLNLQKLNQSPIHEEPINHL